MLMNGACLVHYDHTYAQAYAKWAKQSPKATRWNEKPLGLGRIWTQKAVTYRTNISGHQLS